MKELNLEVNEIDILQLHRIDYPELALIKSRIESDLETLFDLLSHKYKFDMILPLVIDGFPRSDVDLVSIRLLRTKIIRLRNDHREILSQIDKHLTQKFAVKEGHESETVIMETPKIPSIPFALVKSIVNNSPSDKAGLVSGDRIVAFDKTINVTNHRKLAAIAKRVNESRDQEICIHILRNGKVIALSLTPSDTWGGQSLLGCHIVLI